MLVRYQDFDFYPPLRGRGKVVARQLVVFYKILVEFGFTVGQWAGTQQVQVKILSNHFVERPYHHWENVN